MGISTVDSYRGAQIFEVVGLADEVVDLCLRGTPSAVGGVTWAHLGQDAIDLHASGALVSPGYYRVRNRGEYHAHSKDVVQALNDLTLVKEPDDQALEDMTAAHLLQRAINGESYDLYESFRALVDDRPPTELHDLLALVEVAEPLPLDEVEPAADIARRFSTGAMSHGALSKEAHETLAQAMNLLGGLSNCGEGGEDPYRYYTRGQGRDDKNSRIKQIASGRFGVTPEYLVHADELQIKMAQGSKPGEGGQLPGHKVSEEIARLRHTQPGVGLISPAAPPRHLLHRGPGPAHLRPQAGQRRPGVGEAGGRGRRRHHRRRLRQGAGRRHPRVRRQRRHRRQPPVLDQARGHGLGARPGRHPAGPGRQRSAGPGPGAGRRRLQDRPPGHRGRPARRRRVLLRDLGDDRRGLHHAPGLPQGHLQAGRGHPAAPPAGELHRDARGRGRVPAVRGRGRPPPPRPPRRPLPGRRSSAGSIC